mmetsp:Transcript_31303/g.93434  ORF Transcript_31303/g.93434 Transcript_31303/m.93434 type:complete len:244 (+) Transcript_31303:1082-1813(+)
MPSSSRTRTHPRRMRAHRSAATPHSSTPRPRLRRAVRVWATWTCLMPTAARTASRSFPMRRACRSPRALTVCARTPTRAPSAATTGRAASVRRLRTQTCAHSASSASCRRRLPRCQRRAFLTTLSRTPTWVSTTPTTPAWTRTCRTALGWAVRLSSSARVWTWQKRRCGARCPAACCPTGSLPTAPTARPTRSHATAARTSRSRASAQRTSACSRLRLSTWTTRRLPATLQLTASPSPRATAW